MRAIAVLVALVVVGGACAAPQREDRAGAPNAPATTPPAIFEHERSGHLPIQLIPGTWMRAGHTLNLGYVEVVLDRRRIGSYGAAMKGRGFDARVPSCPAKMTWEFVDGDLILEGGGKGCPLRGRWRRA